jgi:hypothetical protein
MISLLKRFEEDNLDDPFANPENSDDEGGDDLEQRLAGIDLGQFYLVELVWPRVLNVRCRKCFHGYVVGCAEPRGARPFHACCTGPGL